MTMTRGDFVRAAALTTAAGAALLAGVVSRRKKEGSEGDPSGEETVRNLGALKNVEQKQGDDVLLVMQRDLVRAMARPVEQRHWVMLIDLRKCIGCHACTIGCVAENKLPPGVVYRPVMTEEGGEFPNTKLSYLPRPCMQCRKPSCVQVCPVNATWKRADGVTVVDYDKCIGCRHCLTACPYGARTSDFGSDYQAEAVAGAGKGKVDALMAQAPNEAIPNNEYAKSWSREHHSSPIGNARKCHFCLHRLEHGQLPVCVTTCIGRATFFGDVNDSEALITELIHRGHTKQLLAHYGNDPSVYYIE